MSIFDLYPSARRTAYTVQWIVNGIMGVVAIVLTALGLSPTWWIITQAVINFVWTYTGLVAQANTVTTPDTDGSAYVDAEDYAEGSTASEPTPE